MPKLTVSVGDGRYSRSNSSNNLFTEIRVLLNGFCVVLKLGRLGNLRIALVGDLKHGRTVHSLARLLDLFDVRMDFVSPGLFCSNFVLSLSVYACGCVLGCFWMCLLV